MTQEVSFAHQIIVVIRLTIREARRRRMLWLGLGLGLVFVGIYAAGLYFAWTDFTQHGPARQGALFASIFLSAGLYVVNFLVVMVTALTTVGTISGEIDTATIHAIAAKPIRRWEIILGKWIGHALLTLSYTTLLAVGVMLAAYFVTGFATPDSLGVLLVLMLESLVVLSLSLLGGTLMSTLANGIVVFMLYGVAFAGGWVEQIGSVLGSHDCREYRHRLQPVHAQRGAVALRGWPDPVQRGVAGHRAHTLLGRQPAQQCVHRVQRVVRDRAAGRVDVVLQPPRFLAGVTVPSPPAPLPHSRC